MDTVKPLCESCSEAVWKWTFIDPMDARAIATASGKPAIETIRSQIRMIRETCRAHH